MSIAFLYLFGALAVVGALGTVLQRHPIHAALSLLGSMLSLAAVYALLNAHLIAALQVIIYAGAIIILVVYIIMLLQAGTDDQAVVFRKAWMWSLPLVLVFGVIFGKALFPIHAEAAVLADGIIVCPPGADCEADCADGADSDGDGLTDCNDPDCGGTLQCFGTVNGVGAQLMGPYILPFEVSSLLLLAGMIGALLLTGRRPKEWADEPAPVSVHTANPDGAQAGGRVHAPDQEDA
ncbi:MAG: hypothetical protein GY898_24165 [Proteobacteria bacterium]|nr:hypothetical protein [Pseudomonadota bacterium]